MNRIQIDRYLDRNSNYSHSYLVPEGAYIVGADKKSSEYIQLRDIRRVTTKRNYQKNIKNILAGN